MALAMKKLGFCTTNTVLLRQQLRCNNIARHPVSSSFSMAARTGSTTTGGTTREQSMLLRATKQSSFLHKNKEFSSSLHSSRSSVLLYSSSSRYDNDNENENSTDNKSNPRQNKDNVGASSDYEFKMGQKVQVEVVMFGPLGASIEVIGLDHDPNNIITYEEDAYGYGLIPQKEIAYFRQSRDELDVVVGEVLPGYVDNIRSEDNKVGITLRTFGGKGKATEIGDIILQLLEDPEVEMPGTLPIGDKSTPIEIQNILPGTSKSAFKKAVSSLYKRKLVKPGPNSITLMKK